MIFSRFSFLTSLFLLSALLLPAESEFDSSSDIAEDLLSLLTSVAAADLGVTLPRDHSAAQFETNGIHGGW